jgi:hypothetical protein
LKDKPQCADVQTGSEQFDQAYGIFMKANQDPGPNFNFILRLIVHQAQPKSNWQGGVGKEEAFTT